MNNCNGTFEISSLLVRVLNSFELIYKNRIFILVTGIINWYHQSRPLCIHRCHCQYMICVDKIEKPQFLPSARSTQIRQIRESHPKYNKTWIKFDLNYRKFIYVKMVSKQFLHLSEAFHSCKYLLLLVWIKPYSIF